MKILQTKEEELMFQIGTVVYTILKGIGILIVVNGVFLIPFFCVLAIKWLMGDFS